MLRTMLAWAVLLGSVFAAGRGAAEPGPATVHGAAAVNVRQQPSADSRAIESLPRGSRVTVEDTTGDWSHVVLDDGRRGYMRSSFLAPVVTEAAETAATATPTTGVAGTPIEAPAPDAAGPAPAVDHELEQLHERLAALEAALAATAQPTATHLPGAGASHPAIPAAPVATIVVPPAALDVGPALALAGVGLIVGFLFGTLYGQRQERSRRSRVRF